eukprot:gene4078-8112_t
MCEVFGTIDHKKNTSSQTLKFCPIFLSSSHKGNIMLGYCDNFSAGSWNNGGLHDFNGSHFMKFMIKSNTSITFIGDSLSRQMHNTLLCILESQNISLSENGEQNIRLNESMFLARLSNPYYLPILPFHGNLTLNNISFLINEGWDEGIIDSPFQNKIVILNTGAWWGPHHIRISETEHVGSIDDMMILFEKHFAPDGPVDRILHRLTNHNATVIWRELAPTGFCNGNKVGQYGYSEEHDLFYRMNMIARQLFTNRKRRHVLPHIYEVSLPLWSQHRSAYKGNNGEREARENELPLER